ncbi:hypothetical protein INT48_006881 [Thamnidium elegans]|uniref:Major facilitator superfamily (MFS) profile domain-containing protein n=1 Tax=Thamnidium elegans TaxID=101142 RepID=A0A8H7SKA1_9FUNG|nr:hypothetical protein INT48_006881 [Thamnidium elegans]
MSSIHKVIKPRPIFFRYRASSFFVFWTAAVGLFTSVSITDNIELTSRDTGVLVSLYAVGLLAGSPIFGWLGDRIKQRRLPMLLGTSASMAANLLFMLILYSELGHEAPFIASMILSAIDFVMRLVIIERSSAPAEWFEEDQDIERRDNASCDSPEKVRHQVTWLRLLKQPRLIVSLALTAIVATVMSAFEPTLSLRLAQEWGFNAAGCSLIVLAYMVPSIIASIICGKLCDRYGTKIVALVSLLLATPSCILIGVPSSYHGSFWPLVPILIMGGITIAGCQAPVFPEIAKVVDNENGGDANCSDGLARSYSLFNAAYGVGMCVGPLAAGYLYACIGFFWLCTILSSLFFCFIPLAYFFIGGDTLIIKPAPVLDEPNVSCITLTVPELNIKK